MRDGAIGVHTPIPVCFEIPLDARPSAQNLYSFMDHNLSRNNFILERPLVSMHGVVGAIAYLQSPIPVLQTAWSERDISWQRVGGRSFTCDTCVFILGRDATPTTLLLVTA